ncbi:MAG: hypothetical protein JNM24_09005 [Bdellovibrionaceae bacterium]|nr:hypothetical protein [Pseudobdellovibrionaceae bacterium]
MAGAIKLIKFIIWFSLALGATDTLFEATEYLGKEAVKAHQKGGVKFKHIDLLFRQCKKASIPSGEHPKMDLVLG